MRRLLFLVPILLAAGCSDSDRAAAQRDAGAAFASASRAVGTAWDSLSKEIAKIDLESSKQALDEAKKQAEALRDRLSKVEIKNPLTEAQMEAAKEQLAKVQAAIQVQNLKEESEAAVQKAIESGKVAKQKYEDASRELASVDSGYHDLRTRLDQAQGVYDHASAALQAALEKVKSLVGTN